jgi:hypothetical protein
MESNMTLLLIAIVILLGVLVAQNKRPISAEQKQINRSFAKFVGVPFLVVMLLAAFLSWANAAQAASSLPQEFVGKYCFETGETSSLSSLDDWTEQCPPDSWITIGRDHHKAHEESCRFVKVTSRFDRTIPAATKTPLGVTVYTVTAKCVGEGTTWRGKYDLYFSKGALYMKSK